jgi:LysM repeat protein
MKLTIPFRKKKQPTKKLRANTGARRHARTSARTAEQGFDDDEPGVSLSGAFIVVLLLHVVAIGGIFAFTKARQHAPQKPRTVAETVANQAQQPARQRTAPRPAAPKPAQVAAKSSVAQATHVAAAPAATRETPAAAATPDPAAAPEAPVKDSGQVYTVAKGDNPVTIAKKFKVSSADLVRLNGIDDPRRVQIGQKLKIPATRN